jgi:hypothetical protein
VDGDSRRCIGRRREGNRAARYRSVTDGIPARSTRATALPLHREAPRIPFRKFPAKPCHRWVCECFREPVRSAKLSGRCHGVRVRCRPTTNVATEGGDRAVLLRAKGV